MHRTRYLREITASWTRGPPSAHRAALSGPQAAEWLLAYQKDYAAKVKNKTFTLVPRPKGRRVVPTKVAHAFKPVRRPLPQQA